MASSAYEIKIWTWNIKSIIHISFIKITITKIIMTNDDLKCYIFEKHEYLNANH